MSRTPADRLLQRVASDPGFKLLPEALQLLWFQLLAWSVTAVEKGRVRFPGSVSSSVSRLFCIPETQAETQLETLENLALLEIDADSNSLWMPGARFSAERSQAAKANGTRGGRPRKGETLEQCRARRERERDEARRQGHLIMAVPGGLAETQETQAEPNSESSRATTTTSQILIGSGGSTARELSSLGLLETQLATAARVEPGRLNLEPLQDWLDKGASIALLQRVVAQVASRSTYHPSKVSTWGYFGPAVIQALGELQAVATLTTVPSQLVQPVVPVPLDPTCELAGAEAAWVAVHEKLQDKLGSTAYRAWISQLALLNVQDGLAVIAAPSAFLRDRVGAEYGVPLRALCQQHLVGCTGYQLVVAANRQQRSA